MTQDNMHRPVSKPYLSAGELGGVAALAALCNAHEGLDLKLNLDMLPLQAGDAEGMSHFLVYSEGQLVGYCNLDWSDDVELCGMVHPAQRRRGIGRALLNAATGECARRGRPRLLLVCEEAAASGRAFAAAVGARHRFAERRMELGTLQTRPAESERIELYRAGPRDAETLVRVRAGAFGDPEDDARHSIAEHLNDPRERYYLGLLARVPVGTLRLTVVEPRAYIYGFGVLPRYRGRGFGRQMLTRVIEDALAERRLRVFIEVDTENSGAYALYRSCGLQELTTYGYYELEWA